MKKTARLTLCAITAALAAAFMLTSYFPYLTYAIPGIAGLFMIMPLVEAGIGYAFASYAVSAVIVIISAEPEAAAVYICLLGYYPILKALIEKIRSRVLEWVIKFAVLNCSLGLIYAVTKFLMNISIDSFGELGKYGVYIFMVLCNITFVFYDIAISKMGALYMIRIHPQIKKLAKK